MGINFTESVIVRTVDNRLVLYRDTIILDNTPISAISEMQYCSLGLTTLQELFDIIPPTVSIIAEVMHKAKDFGNSTNSTDLLTQRSNVDESRGYLSTYRNLWVLYILGWIYEKPPKTVSKGLILEGGSDFTGLFISAKNFMI